MSETRDLLEIAEALAAIGMTPEEGRLYLHLLQAGPSNVGQLAPYFDVSRAKLYRLLDDLSRKGFVSKTPERPTVYHPVFPTDAFEKGRQMLERRWEYLEAVREELLGPLQRMHRAVEGPEPTEWNKISGIEQIYEVVQQVIGEADSSFKVACNRERSVSPRLPAIREAWAVGEQKVDDGLKASFIVGPSKAAFENLPMWVVREDIQARVADIDQPIHFVLVDEEVIVFWVQGSPGQENVAVHTDAEAPVGSHALLFERLWDEAAPLSAGSGPGPQGD